MRSKYPADIQKGIILLEDLYKTHEEGQRDYLYYLAIGTARLKEYTKALSYVKSFLLIEPGFILSGFVDLVINRVFLGNQQVISLQQTIKKKMEKEGLVGMAMAGGVVLAVGAIVGVGMAIVSKVKS